MDPFSIFRDERGSISISRVQAVGVVAILLVGQVVSLWQTGKLAPIDPSLLGLLGISSGTYLGAKAVVRAGEIQAPKGRTEAPENG